MNNNGGVLFTYSMCPAVAWPATRFGTVVLVRTSPSILSLCVCVFSAQTLQVVPLLSHHSNEVVRETLAFLSVMLFNAQRAVQVSKAIN